MGWDWAIDVFKVLLVSAITWVVIYLRKQSKPIIKSLRKFSNIVETADNMQSKIDELKNELAIVKSKQIAMFDILRDPLYILNERGEITYVNNAYARAFGLHDPRDAHGMGWVELIPEANRDKITKLTEMKIAHPSPYEDDVEFEHKITGKIILTECRTALIHDINNKFIGTLGRLYIVQENGLK